MPLKGLFRLKVSQPIPLDFDLLEPSHKQVLCDGVAYNKAMHDLFKFTVSPQITRDFDSGKVPRKLKKQCISRANVIRVLARAGDPEIAIHGFLPRTLSKTGLILPLPESILLDSEVEGMGYKLAKIKFDWKMGWRSEKLSVHATGTEKSAQWHFFRPFIEEGAEMKLSLMAALPKGLPAARRTIVCDATALENGGRRITSSQARLLVIPTIV